MVIVPIWLRPYSVQFAAFMALGGVIGLSVVGYLAQEHYAAYVPAGTRLGPITLTREMKRADVAKLLNTEIAQRRLTVQLPDKTLEYMPAEAGLSYDVDKVVATVKSDGDKLFIESVWQGPATITLPTRLDEAKLTAFTARLAAEQSVAQTPAKFSLAGQVVKVQPGTTASNFKAETLKQTLGSQLRQGMLTVKATPEVSTSPNSPAQLEAGRQAVQKIVDLPVAVMIGDKTYPSTAAERFGWTVVTPTASGDFKISLSTSQIGTFTKTLATRIYVAPTTTTISLLDDAETSRTNGQPGASLPAEAVTSQIASRLTTASATPITVTLTPITPPIKYTRNYSRSSLGFNLLMRDFAAERKLNIGVRLADQSGAISSSYRPTTSFVTASVFKPFLAYAVLDRVDKGDYTMATATPGGKSVQSAIDLMIRVSDNPTAHALHELYGYTSIDPFLHAAGFTSTKLNNYNSAGLVISQKTTTASDVADLFAGLHTGSLLSSGSTSFLVDLMKRQVYRNGIPAGSKPSMVADKVGFLGAYNHDAGIVYSPKGTYVLVIMTNGGSWTDIAELSRRVYRLYNS